MNTERPAAQGPENLRHRILVVDDDAKQLKLIRARLQDAGFVVDATTDTTEALTLLGRHAPDAVMTDVLMRDLDGFGFCRRIREQPAYNHIPVILLSAHYDEEGDRELAQRVGASELVQRTPDFDGELAALRRSLEARSPAKVAPAERATYEQHLRTNAHQLSKLLAQATRAEERYRTLLEHAHDAIMITRLDGTIIEANERWRELLGVPVEELLGRRLQDYAVGDVVLGPTCSSAVEPSGAGTVGPVSFVTRSGQALQMVLSLTVVDVQGESLVLSIGNDVTEALATSRAAARVEQRYRALVERIPDVIWTRSKADSVTFFTPNAAQLFGEPLEALASADVLARIDRVHPDDRETVKSAFALYFDNGIPFDLEYRYRRKDGRWLWLRERSFASTENDGASFCEGMISDVTERKRLEEDLRQSQKMEALGQLTGGIAHDFNNILATILAYAQFIADALPEGDACRADAETIRDAGERAANLTRQLLAFSRRQVLDPRVVDLNAAVTGVQRMLRSIIRENIAFSFLPGADICPIRIDLGQLEQVIMNLVVNACDAMPAGGALTVETAHDRVHDRVLLRVRDTGYGMDAETQRRIFEPFFTTKEKGRGTGLGLSTCYGIVEQSGGRIMVESELGCGTAFTIALPCVDEDVSSVPLPEVGALESTNHETILLIEDDADVRAVLRRLLQQRGYNVLAAQNATEALAIGLDEGIAIDLVVSDIILPGATGLYIVERIRAKRPTLKALFVSGYSDVPASSGTSVASDVCIIEKPFKPDKLLRAVHAELNR